MTLRRIKVKSQPSPDATQRTLQRKSPLRDTLVDVDPQTLRRARLVLGALESGASADVAQRPGTRRHPGRDAGIHGPGMATSSPTLPVGYGEERTVEKSWSDPDLWKRIKRGLTPIYVIPIHMPAPGAGDGRSINYRRG